MRKMTKLIDSLTKLRVRKDKLKESLDKVDEKIDELEDLIMQDMINSGVQSINLVGVGTVYLSKQEFPSIEDVPTFFTYLREHGEEAMIKETVHPQTLRGWWNNSSDELKENPDSIGLTITSKRTIGIRKS